MPEDVKKESSAIEASLNLRIADLEKEIRGNIDNVKNEINNIKSDLKDATNENSKQLTALKDDLSKSIDEKLRSTNRNTTFVIVLGLAILGVLCWYVFTKANLV